ncbi:MAG TPA: winged helix-turn-helix domain-containing protein [Solirubrobacterales bacterium]|nr:winged helix-turn-helix domain-containing protein [Solirubrobacterales bacterium]
MTTERKPRMASRLDKALFNPLRARILESLAEGAASPAQLSERFGEDLDRIAYHVTILAEAGCIRSVETRRERGAVEHVYEPALVS